MSETQNFLQIYFVTVAIPKWRLLKFLKFEMHAAIEIRNITGT